MVVIVALMVYSEGSSEQRFEQNRPSSISDVHQVMDRAIFLLPSLVQLSAVQRGHLGKKSEIQDDQTAECNQVHSFTLYNLEPESLFVSLKIGRFGSSRGASEPSSSPVPGIPYMTEKRSATCFCKFSSKSAEAFMFCVMMQWEGVAKHLRL